MRQTRFAVPVNSVAAVQGYCPPHPPAIVDPISNPFQAKRKVSLFYGGGIPFPPCPLLQKISNFTHARTHLCFPSHPFRMDQALRLSCLGFFLANPGSSRHHDDARDHQSVR